MPPNAILAAVIWAVVVVRVVRVVRIVVIGSIVTLSVIGIR